MQKLRVVIIAGGSYKPCFEIEEDDYVICADHGYDHALKHGIKPDILIGDMDSVNAETNSFPEKLVLPVRKDFTDSETAVKYAIDMNPKEIVLLGFTGTRLDHTLANIFLLKLIHENGIDGYIQDENNIIYYFRDSVSFENKKGYTVSLIPISEKIIGVSTYGLDYPLNNETLYFGETRSISNFIINDKAGYTAKDGNGIVVITKADV